MGRRPHHHNTLLAGLGADLGARLLMAALFALSLVAPRAVLLIHRHDGGEHAHEHHHADVGLLERLFGTGDHHHTHERPAAPRGPTYAADHGAAGSHIHHQERYHAAVAALVAFVAVSTPLAAFVPAVDRPAPSRADRTASARAPPLLSRR